MVWPITKGLKGFKVLKWAELAGLGCLRHEEQIIRIETEPQIFVKSKNGFSKHCLVTNFASYVKPGAWSEKIDSP